MNVVSKITERLHLQSGTKVVSGDKFFVDYVNGQCTLNIKAAEPNDEGEYTCEAHNEHGIAITSQQLLVNCTYSVQCLLCLSRVLAVILHVVNSILHVFISRTCLIEFLFGPIVRITDLQKRDKVCILHNITCHIHP